MAIRSEQSTGWSRKHAGHPRVDAKRMLKRSVEPWTPACRWIFKGINAIILGNLANHTYFFSQKTELSFQAGSSDCQQKGLLTWGLSLSFAF